MVKRGVFDRNDGSLLSSVNVKVIVGERNLELRDEMDTCNIQRKYIYVL